MIACLGEHLSEREGGKTEEVVTQQMKSIAGVWGWGGGGGGRSGEEEGGGNVRVCMYVCVCTYV